MNLITAGAVVLVLLLSFRTAQAESSAGSPLRVVESVAPAEPVESVFMRLHEAEAATVPIVENDRLVGVITLENVTEYMMVHAALTTARKKANGQIKTDLFALSGRTAT